MRVVIADDEPLVRRELRSLLEGEPDVTVDAEYRDGLEAIEGIAGLKPDVALLDIRMPGLSGLEVTEALARNMSPGKRPLIVFVTAYEQYAVHAFEADAADYLLKPVDEARFRAMFERVRQRHRIGERAADAERIDSIINRLRSETPAAGSGYLERLIVQTAGSLRVIPLEAVEWIEADDNYARVHAPDGVRLLRDTLKSLESRLDPGQFVRVHRSAIVRIDRVRELRPQPSGDYELRLASGARVAMSRTYRDAVLARIGTSGGGPG